MTDFKEITSSDVPSVARAKRGMNRPEGTPAKLFNGRDVVWKRIVIPAMEVEAKTSVYAENERVQSLLNSESLSDITKTLSRYGPDKASIGRMVDGIIEVADGSRRRASAIQEVTPYPIDVADLSDDEMLHLSLTGNIYRKPSVYEHGQRYLNLQESYQLNNTQLVDYLAEVGEKVSRRNVSRYIHTASLPIEIIQTFSVANDCSADIGEKLWRSWSSQSADCANSMEMRAVNIRVNTNLTDPKKIMHALLGEKDKPIAEEVQVLHKLAISKQMKNGGTAIELSAEIDADILNEIKQFIELTLAGE